MIGLMKKFFLISKKIETWSEGENEYRGGSGILPVNQSKNKNPLFKAFVDSAGEAGYKIN